ncbi:MAG: ATP-binding protein [Deferribacterales bacterium]|jgi:hypothetical protein
MESKYASAERSSQDIILQLFSELNKVPLIKELIDKTTEIMFVLDQNRQVIFTNKAFLDFLGIDDVYAVLGKRPGEALGCIHSGEVLGCGTTEFCIKCGAVNAILEAQTMGVEAREECLLSVKGGEAYELFVIANPFEFAGHRFTFFTAKDISEKKRKSALEKIFFHDIMNLASGIYSVIDLYKDGSITELPPEMIGLLHQSSSDMVKEINEYRTLLLAEKRELMVMPVMVKTYSVLQDVLKLYKCIADKRCVKLNIKEGTADVEIRTDISLLNRVMINMVKNAIEASAKNDEVTIWAENHFETVSFHVHNPAVMPDDVKTQIFKRTFTTKPSGSGLGTYSMKLLGENYLKGKVSFVSETGKGTEFILSLPI